MLIYRIIKILLLATISLHAQNGGSLSYPDARSVAMGSQFAVTSSGVYSITSNPANLALSKNQIEISTVLPIPNFSGSTGSDFLNVADFNYYFGGTRDEYGQLLGRYLNTDDKNSLLSLLNSGNEIRTSGMINLISISVNPGKEIGSIGFSVNDVFGQKMGIPKNFIELALFGNEIGKEYNFDGLALSSSYLREYDLSYARDFSKLLRKVFNKFTVGMTLKYIHGYAYSEVESANTTIYTNEDHSIQISNDMKANFAFSPDIAINWNFINTRRNSNIGVFPSPAGKGWGINLGFAAELNKVWTFGLSITDIGNIYWNNETVTYAANGNVLITDITDSELLDLITNAIEPTGAYSSGFISNLPTTLRLGATLQLDKFIKGSFPGEMLLAFGYNQGLNNSVNNTSFPLFSLGFEWKPIEVIPIRSGITIGGVDGIGWSFGFGIDAGLVEFNLATSNMSTAFIGNDSKLVHMVVGSKWKF
ncbi:MAG: DUF5723 family protein [Bacteroidota bacterium]